jgi:lysyl-tRNA synthetase class II
VILTEAIVYFPNENTMNSGSPRVKAHSLKVANKKGKKKVSKSNNINSHSIVDSDFEEFIEDPLIQPGFASLSMNNFPMINSPYGGGQTMSVSGI